MATGHGAASELSVMVVDRSSELCLGVRRRLEAGGQGESGRGRRPMSVSMTKGRMG